MRKISRENPLSLQHQLYASLKEWFVQEFTLEDTLPTETVIAETFNVSRGTVRIAMDNLVKEGIITRVPGQGSFLTKNYYVWLKNYKVGLILSDIDFFTNSIWEYDWAIQLELINGIIQDCPTYNLTPELISEKHFSENDNDAYDGFIVWPFVHQSLLDKLKKPNVTLYYEINLQHGFSLLTQDIVRNNFRKPAFIGFTSGGRIEAVNTELIAKEKPPIESTRIIQCGGNPKEAYKACSLLFKAHEDIDCIICSTDLRAQGVIDFLIEKGKRIPDDVAVYGFDGNQKSNLFSPKITTCCFDWTYPGKFAVQNIRAALDKKPDPQYDPPDGVFIKKETTP